MKNMLSAVKVAKPAEGQTFYRGRPKAFSDIRAFYQGGRKVIWAGFTSCSKRLDQASFIASWEKGCVLELTVPVVHDIGPFSFYPHEQEVLLKPNVKLSVTWSTRIEEHSAADGSSHMVKVIKMCQILWTPMIS